MNSGLKTAVRVVTEAIYAFIAFGLVGLAVGVMASIFTDVALLEMATWFGGAGVLMYVLGVSNQWAKGDAGKTEGKRK